MSPLPRGWVEARLAELCQFNPKHDPATDQSIGVNFIPMPAVDEEAGTIVDKSVVRPLSEVWKGYTHFSDHDVIFAKITPCMENGKIAVARDLANGMACGSTEFHVLRSNGAVEPDYVWQFLRRKSYRQIAEHSMTGAVGQRRVPRQFLEDTELPLPPLAEQKRILAKLDALKAQSARARTELARIETLTSRYKQAVLSKAFGGELTRDWRYPVKQMGAVSPRLPQQVKSAYRLAMEQAFDAPYELPECWKWLTFPALGDLDRGKSRHRPRNDPRLFDGPFPYIQTGEVRAAEQYVREHSQTYSEFGFAQSKLWPPETLCITIAANIAETALLSYPACFPDSVVGFSADADKILPKYAEFFLRTAKERISQFAPATAQKNINLEILAAVRLPVAPLQEQHEIVRRIESAFAKIDQLAAEARRALELVGRLDEAILAKAFRGELVPQNENDEPAEKLLERIYAERTTAPKAKHRRKAVLQ